MKKIFNFLRNLFVIVYILIIIFVTICLLSYNDYKVAVIGKSTFIPIIDENLEPNYKVGDLLIVEKNRLSDVSEGDEIFFYRTAAGEAYVTFATVTNVEKVSNTEFTYTVEGNYRFSSSNFIGKVDTATVIPNVGSFLSVLQSKWGFLFIGVFPSLIVFLYTLYSVFLEIREGDVEEEKVSSQKQTKKIPITSENKVIEQVAQEKENTETSNIKLESKKEVENNNESKKENNVLEVTEVKQEKTENKEKTEVKEKAEVKETVEDKKVDKLVKQEKAQTEEQKKKAIIEARMKSMTEEEKKALIQAKLKSMTEAEKRALIEAKKKKMEAEKNKKIGDKSG